MKKAKMSGERAGRTEGSAAAKKTDKARVKAEKNRAALRERAEKKRVAMRRKAEIEREKARIAEKHRLDVARKRAQARLERERAEKEREQRYRLKAELKQKRRRAREAVARAVANKLKNSPDAFGYENSGFIPRVRITADGDPTGLAAAFAQGGIPFEDMTFSGGKTSFKIRKKDCGKVIAILSEMCYNYQIGARYGIGRAAKFALCRIGLAVGAAVCAFGLFAAYSRVWTITVEGNVVLSEQAVLKALERAGAYCGADKSSLSPKALCAALMQTEGIADASCEIVGTTLNVRVLESSDCVSPEKRTAYVSDYDATVTRVVVRSGSALVKRGDAVAAGAMLVSGDVYSTAGELMYTVPCDADVYGNVSLGFTATVGATHVDFVRTGRSEHRTVLGVFGYNIGSAKCGYRHYEAVRHTSRYDLLLPLYVTGYTFYETSPVEVERDVRDIAREAAEDRAQKLRFTGDFEQSYNVTPTGGGMYAVHIFLSGEARISRGV